MPGAGGYVAVDAPLPDLLTVLRVAQRGGAACCAPTASRLRARLFGCPSLTDGEAQVAAIGNPTFPMLKTAPAASDGSASMRTM
jgi:hypothetical protein